MNVLPAGQAITLSDIVRLISDVVNILLIVSGVVVVGIIVWAGILVATSRGDTGQYKKGMDTLKNGVIGAIVIFGVGVIVRTLASFAQAPTQILR